MYPEHFRYSQEHEWVQTDGEEVVLGITHFAQEELGEVVFVELPEVGQQFEAGDEIGTIESVKAVAELYTPVAGEVTVVNDELVDSPERLNEDPHETGWLVRLKVGNTDRLETLMSAEEYSAFIETGSTGSNS